MLRKELLAPEKIGTLLTHWYEIDINKFSRLSKATLRASRFNKSVSVLSTAPILVYRYYDHFKEFNYVIHGKHRALVSYQRVLPAEACIVSGVNDITYHTPRECLIDGDLEKTLTSFEFRFDATRYAKMEGAVTIADLAKKYLFVS